MNMQDKVVVFSFKPKCKKCGREMYLSTHFLPIDMKKEVPCWKCPCGNATFSEEQLKEMGVGQKTKKKSRIS